MKKGLFFVLAMLMVVGNVSAYQRFVHLTSQDVRIDSIIPKVGYILPLTGATEDSTYTVSVVYPEFMDMSDKDIKAYERLSEKKLPEIPEADMFIAYDRKKPVMYIDVVPMAKNEGKYKWVTSFMLRIESKAKSSGGSKVLKAQGVGSDYAKHSVLASGSWAKIRVDHTGIFELTNELIAKAGFTDINKVKVYGYGGNMQPEAIQKSYLYETDDLKEVPQYTAGGKHLFYAKGPVTWSSATVASRTRNPYSDYGYYFITQNDSPTSTLDASSFKEQFYHAPEDYHDLYEVDNYSFFHGGRNLYDSEKLVAGSVKDYTFTNKAQSSTATFTVNVAASSTSSVTIYVNGTSVGSASISLGSYDKAHVSSTSYTVNNLNLSQNTVRLKVNSGNDVHLDNIDVAYATPYENYALDKTSYSVPEYVENVANQDLHGEGEVDMVVIVPKSQLTVSEAQRLMEYHKKNDGLTYRIVSADQLYNEFSSGTPDANAYRRYLKMMYDRSLEEETLPKYLLLYGNCVWDNRMKTSTTASLNPDDYLLCFESENSVNEVYCYCDDGWFTLLDEGEGLNPQSKDKQDVAVGRFPVTTLTDANTLTSKVISYMDNAHAGKWQNTVVIMGDDGNDNLHMKDANEVSENLISHYPEYNVKKVMWDTFERETTASGNTYPQLTTLLKQYQKEGALIMDYSGHGSPTQMSHEQVLRISDFSSFKNVVYPLWITASCDIMPFDTYTTNIGVTSLLNTQGGSCAFFGTTRTVYANYNKQINKSFTQDVLDTLSNGKPMPLGEAQRHTKNYLIESGLDTSRNKLQFSLLGDPAMSLQQPGLKIKIDSINHVDPALIDGLPQVKAGGKMNIKGHVVGGKGGFNGTVYIIVYDSKSTVVCRKNASDTTSPYTYQDRTATLYNGNTNVTNDYFTLEFTVPLDINYSNENGKIIAYAVSDKSVTAHGHSEDFIVGGTESTGQEGNGPTVYCYLNTTNFQDGDKVNTSPMFYAQIYDESGINVAGTGIGHDLTLIVDGEMQRTYNLNGNFIFDGESQAKGTTYYQLTDLEDGEHNLQFRAWDIFNNPSTTSLNFVVDKKLAPEFINLVCTNNPATDSTQFIITHDRIGVVLKTKLEVVDMSGRTLWQNVIEDTYDSDTAVIPWDLTMDGVKLQTGVYLYRVTLQTQDSEYSSKSKKLIVVNK